MTSPAPNPVDRLLPWRALFFYGQHLFAALVVDENGQVLMEAQTARRILELIVQQPVTQLTMT